MRHRNTIVAAAVAVALLATATPQSAAFDAITPPPVPADLSVPAGFKPFLLAHAIGTQNYVCRPSATAPSGFAWILFGPQATLFDDADGQVITHFLSPNPIEGGKPRGTWQHSRDTSAVWAAMTASSDDAAYVAPGAIPWFKLEWVGAKFGPTYGDRLTGTRYIQRVNTAGGIAPADGCAAAADAGKTQLVSYAADYIFYKAR